MTKPEKGERWTAYNADTVDVACSLPSQSIDFSVFSPPFASLYVYSASERDMGNVRDTAEFFDHYDFIVRETGRVMKPGRLVAFHCMLLPTTKTRNGYIGLKDFRGDLIRAYERHGFVFHSEVTIWKDPVTAMQRTKALGLLYKQLRKDSTMSRQGIADYVVVMKAPGTNEIPVTHDFDEFPVEQWQRWASPVWVSVRGDVDAEGFAVPVGGSNGNGIDQSETLNARSAREHDDERHLAPLQLEVIRRCVRLWSNPGELVWSPFMGIGSEGVIALELGRQFVGAELKGSYYRQAVANLQHAERVAGQQSDLFGAVAR